MAIKTKHDISKQNFTNSHGGIAIALLIFFCGSLEFFALWLSPPLKRARIFWGSPVNVCVVTHCNFI